MFFPPFRYLLITDTASIVGQINVSVSGQSKSAIYLPPVQPPEDEFGTSRCPHLRRNFFYTLDG